MTKKLSDAEYLRSIDHRFNVVEFKRLHEIADEIEQIRQERHQLRNELTAAGLENDRLQASERSAWNAAVIREEQIERLRKALQDITCVATPEHLNDDEAALATMRGIAGEAISGSPSEPDGVLTIQDGVLTVLRSVTTVSPNFRVTATVSEPGAALTLDNGEIPTLRLWHKRSIETCMATGDREGAEWHRKRLAYFDEATDSTDQDGRQAPAPSGNAGLGTTGGASSLHQSSEKSEAPLGSREREAYEAELKRLRDSLAQRTNEQAS